MSNIYANSPAGPAAPAPRGEPPPAARSSRSTPDLLDTVKDIFADDPDPVLFEAARAGRAQENLAQSYDYFKKRHERAKNEEERNKVLNAAHRHYQKSKLSHRDHTDVVEAAYLHFLESVGNGNPVSEETGAPVEEYNFFLEQYNKAPTDAEREAANAAAHRYFALQYQGCRDEIEKARSSVAYQEFLDNRLPHGASFSGVGLPRSVQAQFDFHLEQFKTARSEEQRVEAMTKAHDYFMQLSSACRDETELTRLGNAYQSFLGAQKASLVEFRETQAMAASMSASGSAAAASSSRGESSSSTKRSRSARTTKKITTTTRQRSTSPGPGPPPPGPPQPPPPPPPKEETEIIMVKPLYYLRWMYLCLFFQLLFIFGIILIFLFGAFAGCWLRYTTSGMIVFILCWVILVILIVCLAIFAPKRQLFPWSVIWFIILTILLAICLALTSVMFNTLSILIVLVGLMTVFLVVFMCTLLPISYTGARLVFVTLLCWLLCAIAFWVFLAIAGKTLTTGWIYILLVILIISIWVAIDAMIVVSNKFVNAMHDDWMFGAVCCYTDPLILALHLCYMPFSPASATRK